MRIGYLQLDRAPAEPLAGLLAPLTPALQLDAERPGAWFEASGIRLQYGDEGRYGRAILAAIAAAGGAGRLGIASTPWVARIAARLADPDEVLIVPEHETRAFLRPLPLAWLPLPRRILSRLRALGIATIGQFADLPPASVQRRFGADALRAHRLARGDDPTPFQGCAPVEPLRFQRTFDPPVTTSEALGSTLRALCAAAAQELARHTHAARSLCLELVSELGQVERRARRFPSPLGNARELDAAAQALLPRAPLAQPVGLLRLVIEEYEPVQARQPSLLAEAAARRQMERERLQHLLERHAPGRVARIVEHCPAAPLPEWRWRLAGDHGPLLLAGEPVRLQRRGHRWWLEQAGRWHPIVRGGHWERVDLWWPEERHRRVIWVELADGQRLILRWETSDRIWRLVGRLD